MESKGAAPAAVLSVGEANNRRYHLGVQKHEEPVPEACHVSVSVPLDLTVLLGEHLLSFVGHDLRQTGIACLRFTKKRYDSRVVSGIPYCCDAIQMVIDDLPFGGK